MQFNRFFSAHFYLIVALLFIFNSCSQTDGTKEKFAANLEQDIRKLSSNEFEGRAPTTPGGIKTIEYITSRYREIGLVPANGESFLQAVPLVEITGYNFSPLKVSGKGNSLSFEYLDEMVIGSSRLLENLTVENSELVFAGYGIVAPEYGWNDYEGIDVTGKTVIVLVNDPGFSTEDQNLFTGKAMTYYGRWTYKFEEAARQGAAGALIIHQTEPASYGWQVVRNSWSGTQYNVASRNGIPPVIMEGWLHLDAAKKIFSAAGIDLDDALEKAISKEFEAFHLGLKASATFKNQFKHSECSNVIGYIKGSQFPDETIIYMAHWDHLGKFEEEGEIKIYNGAVDNATGVAGLMALAEHFLQEKENPKRSIVFMAVTAEESGLLGSRLYSENPLFPLATTVAGINMDALNVYGPTSDIIAVGYGFSELDDYLKRHAAKQQRTVKPDPYPERGYYYRSDHFNLARFGVPMIYAKGGNDYIGRDEEYSKMVRQDYAERYHEPSDVIHDLWDFEGMKQDLSLFYNIGKELSENRDFPKWSSDNEFRAIREESNHLRQ
jgi:Zn-dependent M28 family amino/carboxypeptidase